MASRRKRGPVVFRPRLSAGLALSLLLVTDYSRWITDVRYGSLGALHSDK